MTTIILFEFENRKYLRNIKIHHPHDRSIKLRNNDDSSTYYLMWGHDSLTSFCIEDQDFQSSMEGNQVHHSFYEPAHHTSY